MSQLWLQMFKTQSFLFRNKLALFLKTFENKNLRSLSNAMSSLLTREKKMMWKQPTFTLFGVNDNNL